MTIWPGNLLDTVRLPGLVQQISPTHLLHVAWNVTHGSYWTAADNLDWLEAGVALLRAFHAAGGRRAVGVGTCAEYGWTVERYSELEAPLQPATCYGMSKLALGQAFQAAGELGLSTAWARLFFPFGPGEQPGRLVSSVITSLIGGVPAECTAGTQVRDYLYIDDVGAALTALLDTDVRGPVNIGSGSGTQVRDLVLLAARHVGRPELVRLGALPARPTEPPSVVANTTRLNVEVGFIPAVPLEEAIRRNVAYWADRHTELTEPSVPHGRPNGE
jgi:nucleoside-diphosphate-sugar epimerase